jgi:phosphinothricin acetyltransferase
VRTHTASFEIDAPDEGEIRRRWLTIREGGYPYVVAASTARVLGYCYASMYRPRPAYRFTTEDSVYVAPDCTQRGVGRALLEHVIDACTRAGLREIIAIIGDSANEPSIRLHARLGFVHVGTLRNVGYKFDRWLDSVIMQRSLEHGSE